MKGEKIGQLSAEKGMDEAAMEGAAGSGGGDGLASGAAHASDLDVLRDNPGAAASRAAPGRHDREAARVKPAQPAGSAVMAASDFRKLAPALFQKVPHPPGGPVNKTQPKAPLPQEGFGMSPLQGRPISFTVNQ